MCVCRHSITAHNIEHRAGCIFCGCLQFQRPVAKAVEAPVTLSKFSASALELLQQRSGLPGLGADAMAAFVKDGKGRMFAPGTRLVSRGDTSRAVHVVLSGSVVVQKDRGSQGEELGVGCIAGDLRAFTGEPRWASITTVENTATLEIDTTQLSGACAKHPELFKSLIRSVMPFSEHHEEIMKSPLWAAGRRASGQAEPERREGLDPEKRLEIAARWEMLKRQQRAADEAAWRARQVAGAAIRAHAGR